MYDFIIIGAGVSGAFIAAELAKYNLKIAVIDRCAEPSQGSSKANTAIVHGGYDAVPNSLKALLNVRGAMMMDEVANRLHVDYDKCGTNVVAFDSDDITTLEGLLERGKINGVENIRLLSQSEIRKMEPNISDEVKGSLFCGNAGIISSYKLAVAALELAAENSVEFIRDTNVISMEESHDHISVITDNGSFESRYIVNAAGIFADKIARMLGDDSFSIIPRKGEYILLDKYMKGLVNTPVFQTPSKMGKGILVSPTTSGNILLGPTAYDINDKEDKSTTKEGIAEIIDKARRSIPSLNTSQAITLFSGLRATPDTGDFIIKQSDFCKRMFLAAGIESPGLTSSPAIGEYLASIIKNTGILSDLKPGYVSQRRKEYHISKMDICEANEVIKQNSSYGRIVCRCEKITEGEIVDAIKRPAGAITVDGVKMRTRAGMGRCQGGFCTSKIIEIIARELGIKKEEVRKSCKNSNYLVSKLKGEEFDE